MAEKDDLDIIESLIDANCRAYNDEFGEHYDSRCLEHYNKAIARLIGGGRVSHHAPSPGKGKVKVGTLDAEEVDGQLHPRLRSSRIPAANAVARPTTDPMWSKWQEDNLKLRAENARLKGLAPDNPNFPI